MVSAAEAVQFVRALVGGSPPHERDKIVYTENGWRLRRDHWLGVLEDDPDDPEDGDFWYNSTDDQLRVVVSGATYESAAWTVKP